MHDGKEYIFIDTAGLRRKNKIKEELERYSIIRTVSAVERADVVLMVIDATEGVTEQDAKIAGIAHERGKGVIIVVNKWDGIEKNDKTMIRIRRKDPSGTFLYAICRDYVCICTDRTETYRNCMI